VRTRREKPRRARKPLAGIPALLPRYRSGELTSKQFFEATSGDFVRMAVALMRGWDLPFAVDEHDVAQELREKVLKYVASWDPSRADLAKYCVFAASDKTKRWMHQQRSAPKENQGKQASRHPLLLIDACEREEEREAMIARGERPPTPEDLVIAAEREAMAQRIATALGQSVESLTRHVEVRASALRIALGEVRPRIDPRSHAPEMLRVEAFDSGSMAAEREHEAEREAASRRISRGARR